MNLNSHFLLSLCLWPMISLVIDFIFSTKLSVYIEEASHWKRLVVDTSKQCNREFLYHDSWTSCCFQHTSHKGKWRSHQQLDVEVGKWDVSCQDGKSVYFCFSPLNFLTAQLTKMQLWDHFDYPVVEPFICVKWIKQILFFQCFVKTRTIMFYLVFFYLKLQSKSLKNKQLKMFHCKTQK